MRLDLNIWLPNCVEGFLFLVGLLGHAVILRATPSTKAISRLLGSLLTCASVACLLLVLVILGNGIAVRRLQATLHEQTIALHELKTRQAAAQDALGPMEQRLHATMRERAKQR